MKLYLFTIVLIVSAGSALSARHFMLNLKDIVKKDLVHPMMLASQDTAASVYHLFEPLYAPLGKVKRDLLTIPGLGSYLKLDNVDSHFKAAVDKGAKYLVSKRQLSEAINGIIEYLRSIGVKGLTFNVHMDKTD